MLFGGRIGRDLEQAQQGYGDVERDNDQAQRPAPAAQQASQYGRLFGEFAYRLTSC